MPHRDLSVQQLRKQVVEARKKTALIQERKRLESELFKLRNPGLLTVKRGFVSGAKAFRRGAAITARGIQKFAVRQQEFQRLREKGQRKVKPVVKAATVSKRKAFKKFKISSPIIKKKKKRRTFQRNNNDDGFSNFSPMERFDF